MKLTDKNLSELISWHEDVVKNNGGWDYLEKSNTKGNLEFLRELQSLRKAVEEVIKEITDLLEQEDEEETEFINGFDAGLERALYYIKKYTYKHVNNK